MNWKQRFMLAKEKAQQGNFSIAEYMLNDALTEAKRYGPTSNQVLETKTVLLDVYARQGKLNEYEELLVELVTLREQDKAQEPRELANWQLKVAELKYGKGDYSGAEMFAMKSFHTHKIIFGPEHVETAKLSVHLAFILQAQGKYDAAEALYKSAMTVLTKSLGSRDQYVVNLIRSYAVLLEHTHRELEAEHLLKCIE